MEGEKARRLVAAMQEEVRQARAEAQEAVQAARDETWLCLQRSAEEHATTLQAAAATKEDEMKQQVAEINELQQQIKTQEQRFAAAEMAFEKKLQHAEAPLREEVQWLQAVVASSEAGAAAMQEKCRAVTEHDVEVKDAVALRRIYWRRHRRARLLL